MRKIRLNEQFTDNNINEDIWNIRVGNKWANQELQAYTSRVTNVKIEDERLIITGRHEQHDGREYTSARLDTREKFSIQYGTIEVEAQVPDGIGTWPAIWLLAEDIHEVGWPKCGEIDIMEHCGIRLDKVFFSIHTKTHNHQLGNAYTKTMEFPNIHKGIHKFSFVWKYEYLAWLVDDVEVFRVERLKNANEENWPFDKKYFLIMNMAIGGNFCDHKVEPADFPKEFIIKSVKVYED